MLHARRAKGEAFRKEFQAMVHGIAPVRGLPGFTDWYRDASGMASFLALAPEERQRIIDTSR